MGHYASEMACPNCGGIGGGQYSCSCQPEPTPANGNFIVTNDFRVLTVDEFDEEITQTETDFGGLPLNPLMYRFGKTQYKTRLAAEKEARELCEKAVERLREDLYKMKRVLVTERPWEKK